jgi:hypothetical protein
MQIDVLEVVGIFAGLFNLNVDPFKAGCNSPSSSFLAEVPLTSSLVHELLFVALLSSGVGGATLTCFGPSQLGGTLIFAVGLVLAWIALAALRGVLILPARRRLMR